VQGFPNLSAMRARVFANWLSYIEAPRIGVGHAQSVDRGTTWLNQSGFPITDQDESISQRTASCLDLLGNTHFVTGNGPVRYMRGSGTAPTLWSALQQVLSYAQAVKMTPTLVCEPDGSAVYLAASEVHDVFINQSYVTLTRSLDGGASWAPAAHASNATSLGPSLAVDSDGSVSLTYVDLQSSQVFHRRSADHGATFGFPGVVALVQDNLGTPPFGWHRSFSIEGDPAYPLYQKARLAPNFPALAVDRSSMPTHGNLYVVWAEYAEGDLAPATSTHLSDNSNVSFDTAKLLPLDCDVTGSMDEIHQSNRARYFAFDGAAGQTIWIDGTATPFQKAIVLIWELPGGERVVSQVSYLTSTNPGSGSTAPIILSLPYTGRYYLRIDPPTSSSISFAFRLRRYLPTPASASRDMRDVVLVRSTDGGQTWSDKLRVNHDSPGVDQHQPNVAVDERGNVYVAWYDRRGSSGGNDVHAYAAVSNDGGVTFGPDLKLSSQPSMWMGVEEPQFHFVPGSLIGDRIAIAAGDDYAIAAWTDLRNWPTRSDVYAARIVDAPTAVSAVSDLRGEAVSNGIRLAWVVNDARSVSALRIHRQAENEGEVALGDGDLVPNRSGQLEFLDETVEPGHAYAYRLQVRGANGITWLGPVEVTMPERIASLAWRSAWPNPFGGRTSIKLAVPRRAVGAVRVYDVQGKEVRTLAEGPFEPGECTLEWDGRDAAGNASAAGIYFISAQVGGENARLRVARVP